MDIKKPEHHDTTFDVFLTQLFELNPDGDPVYCYELLDYSFNNIKEDKQYNPDTGNLYNFNDIVDKYKEYLDQYDSKYGDTEEKFIKAENRKMNIEDFLRTYGWKKRYPIPQKKRDYYLFGKRKLPELLQMHKNFKDYIESQK